MLVVIASQIAVTPVSKSFIVTVENKVTET